MYRKVRVESNIIEIKQGGIQMGKNNTILKSFDDLPIILDVNDVASIMQISRVSAYELVHTQDFPVIHCGRRLRISKKAFFEWLDKQSMCRA